MWRLEAILDEYPYMVKLLTAEDSTPESVPISKQLLSDFSFSVTWFHLSQSKMKMACLAVKAHG